MHLNKKSPLTQDALIFNYLPAELKKYSCGWQIEYYVEDPITAEMIRIRNRVDLIRKRYSRQTEAISHINKILFDINLKLSKGWNPLIESKENARMYLKYTEVSEKFLSEKKKELRVDSMRSYISYINIFNEYIEKRTSIIHLSNFSKSDAVVFMDFVYNVRKVSQRTYNNYVKFFRLYFNWLKSHCYVNNNYFDNITSKKKEKKKRTIIPPEVREDIIERLSVTNPKLLIVCKLMYYSLLRPKEISMLKIQDVDFTKNAVFVSEEVSKNHKSRFATLTEDLINDLQYLKEYDKNLYLIASNMLPGRKKATIDKYRKEWAKEKKKLKLKDEFQLYSFRDTGIFEMLKSGIDPLTVKQHADHHSLEMTSLYSDHFDPNLNENIRNHAPKF